MHVEATKSQTGILAIISRIRLTLLCQVGMGHGRAAFRRGLGVWKLAC